MTRVGGAPVPADASDAWWTWRDGQWYFEVVDGDGWVQRTLGPWQSAVEAEAAVQAHLRDVDRWLLLPEVEDLG